MELSLRARLRSGDPEAFGSIFDEHAQTVHRYAVRVTGNWATAEDVVSLTFLEAWRLRETVRPEGDGLLPWLLGIATNVLRNTTRAARRYQAALNRVPPHDRAPDFADEVVDRMEDAGRLAAAKRALRRLRRGEREVFALCVWAGLDYAAAAEALDVPVGTVRSRLSRARSRLRKLTDEELASGTTEPASRLGQQQGGRTTAARSIQEQIR
ncbi:RNA polymerase sigma factor [Streptomyces sp. DHE7-1]|uniref:RNA polymerase sigma factor n=1 Tax=Streptomyces sp. NPDC093248 TaxID=3155072 RepID=UPI0018EEB9CE|nr:RNA polymerase sigma factor [Streptomyces sp. DHE7-1]